MLKYLGAANGSSRSLNTEVLRCVIYHNPQRPSATAFSCRYCFALGCFAAPNTAPAQPPRFPNAHEEPPAGWTGPVFELSQDYPTTLPAPEPRPWEEFDYKSQPNEYINAVLQYVYEGNIAVDWRIAGQHRPQMVPCAVDAPQQRPKWKR